MVAFARWRGAKYGNCATGRREGKSKRRWEGFAWWSVGEKGDILSNVAGIIWFYADILPARIARRALRSVICTAGKRSHTKCFYIFYSSPLPLPDRPKPRNLSAPANLHARPFSGRASLANLAIDDPAFFEGRHGKKKQRKISERSSIYESSLLVKISGEKRQLRRKLKDFFVKYINTVNKCVGLFNYVTSKV